MNKPLIFIFVLIILKLEYKGQSYLNVTVNENIELLTVIQFLGKRAVYPQESIYRYEVSNYFKKHRRHSAVKKIQSILDKNSGDGAFPLLGAYCSSLPDFNLMYPLSEMKDTLNKREYLQLCKEFAEISEWSLFIHKEKFKIELWQNQVRDTVYKYKLTERLEDLMGQKRSWNIYLSPLVGWGAYNFILPSSNKENEIHFVMGYNKPLFNNSKDASSAQPFFADKNSLVDLIWHEGSHSYITPLINSHKNELEAYSKLLTEDMQVSLQKAGRFKWNWEYYLNELIVRAIVAKLTDTYFGPEEGKVELQKQKNKGFRHIDRVYMLLAEYEKNETKEASLLFSTLLKDLPNW